MFDEYMELLQRYINFGQIFGLAPLTKSPTSTEFNVSNKKLSVSVVYLILQTSHAVFHLNLFGDIHLASMSSIVHFVWMLQCLVSNVSVACQSLFAAKPLATYINHLHRIDQQMQLKLETVRDYETQRQKHLVIAAFVLIASFMSAWVLYGFVALSYPHLHSLFLFVFVPYAFMSVRVLQMIHSIELLNDHLDVINIRLKNVSGHGKRMDNDGNVSGDLIALRQLYGQCWNALQKYNECFGFSHLMLLLFFSVDVLHGVYTLFLNMHGIRPDLAVLCKYIGRSKGFLTSLHSKTTFFCTSLTK